jgi:hypothetical protein
MTQITQDMIDCWRGNYGLDTRSPADAMRYWSDTGAGMSPAGAVAALGLLLEERDRLRFLLLRQYMADAALYAMPHDCTEAEHVAALTEHDAVHALLAAEFKA